MSEHRSTRSGKHAPQQESHNGKHSLVGIGSVREPGSSVEDQGSWGRRPR